MALSALIAAFLAGALGGVHCLAMCGGFVAALSGAAGRAAPAAVPMRPARALLLRQLTYNAGRIATYTMLGALAGGVGAAALSAAYLMPLQRALFVVANLFLLAVGVSIAGRTAEIAWITRTGASLFVRVAPAIAALTRRDGIAARAILGMIWGFVPCGLVYGVLPISLFAGGAPEGAAVMLAFGLGTLPNLMVAGFVSARAQAWSRSRGVRYAAAAVLVAFAAVGLARALMEPVAHGQGPFCLVV